MICSSGPTSPAEILSILWNFASITEVIQTVPPSVLTGGPPVCCTCVMILAAPPAAAITYVNDSRGLDPSVYGGGGSPSSTLLLDDSPLVSCGSAALVSARALSI